MKIKLNISKVTAFLLVTAAVGFSSCLKTNDTYIDFSKVGTTVELPLAALNQETKVTVVSKSYTASATPTDMDVYVNIASPKVLSKALTVTLAVNAADAIGKLNTATSGGYVLLPTSAYSVSSLQVTIPAGERLGKVTFKINSGVIDKTVTKYILPVSIVDGGGEQISNYNTVYYNIKAN